MLPRVSIVIPAFDGASLTRACLESLWAHTHADVAEVVVVDDASPSTQAQELVEQLSKDPRVRVFRQEVNGGFARACNRGIRESLAPLVVLLNNDTEVLAGWLDPLLEVFGNPIVAAAGSLLLYPGAEIIQHAGIELWRERGVLKPFHIGQFQRLRLTPWAVLNREVPAVTGACLAVRRNALPQGTFLDETFRNGFEDVDLCFRLRTAGWTIRYCGDSQVIHHESLSAGRFSWEQDNLRIFQKRWEEMLDSIPPSQGRMAVHPLRARRRYLQDPSPANAAKVARLLAHCGMSTELPMWEALARGRFFTHRRLSMELRQTLERELGLDQLKIRVPQNPS